MKMLKQVTLNEAMQMIAEGDTGTLYIERAISFDRLDQYKMSVGALRDSIFYKLCIVEEGKNE